MPNFIVRIKSPAGSVVMLPPAWSDVNCAKTENLFFADSYN